MRAAQTQRSHYDDWPTCSGTEVLRNPGYLSTTKCNCISFAPRFCIEMADSCISRFTTPPKPGLHRSRATMPQVVLATVLFALFFTRQTRALRVTFFNQKDFKGDSYTFYGGVTEVGSDCTPCVKVVSCRRYSGVAPLPDET